MSEQEGVAQCEVCRTWFCSGGGSAVHRSNKEKAMEHGAVEGASDTGVSLSGEHWM